MSEQGEAVNYTGGRQAPEKSAVADPLTNLFRRAERPLLIPYAVGGYPDLAGSSRVLQAYWEAGADLIEVGIPFSDPLADGPVIQAASAAALRGGIRTKDILRLAGELADAGAPVILLSYLNTILAFGPGRFFAECGRYGILGVVVPDLPVEESAELLKVAYEHAVDIVFLVAPTSTEGRLARIADGASGFLYCVSTTGVTGARSALRADLPAFLARVRAHTQLPLAVGFGVSTVEQVATVAAEADGVIIGSALVDLVAKAPELEKGLRQITEFLRQGRAAVEAASPKKVS